MSRLRDKEKASIVVEARRMDMEVGRNSALQYLISKDMGGWEGNGYRSGHRVLDYETFLYIDCVPKEHPLWREMRTKEDADISRRKEARKHKPALLERSNGKCEWCGKEIQGRNATVDHIDPEGGNEPGNLALLCRSCNSRKSRGSLDRLASIEVAHHRRAERLDEQAKRMGFSSHAAHELFLDCPCHHYGCPPNCIGCEMCEHDGNSEPETLVCPYGETGLEACTTPSDCWEARRCTNYIVDLDYGEQAVSEG